MDTTKEQFGKIANVVGYRDNPDGTTTNLLSDGTQETGRLIKDTDGSYSFNPIGQNVPTTITSDMLKASPTPLKLPEQQTSTMSTGVIDSITGSNKKLLSELEIEKNKAETAKKYADMDMQDSINQIIGITGSRLEQEQAAGLPQYREEEKKVAKKIDDLELAYRSELKALESSNMTDAGRSAATRDLNRKYDTQFADLAIIKRSVTRDREGAQAEVDRKIELQLEPLKLKLDYQKTIYEDNKDNFTKADDRRYQALIKSTERELNKEEERVKTLENTKLKYMDIAASLGKDNTVLTAMTKATSPEEVIAIASKNGVVSIDDQLRAVQVQEKKFELDRLRNEATTVLGGNTRQANDLTAYAQQFADTGTLPDPSKLKQSGLSVGQVTMLAKQMSKPDGTLVSTNTGVKPSTLSPAQEDGIVALSEIVRETLPSLQQKYPRLWNGIIGGTAGLVFTSQDRQDYQTFRQEFLNKLLKARSGATVTPQEYDRYAALLPGEFSINPLTESQGNKKLISLSTSMKQTLDNELKSKQLSIYGYSTVNVGGVPRKVGEVLDMNGTKLRVLPDGTLTDNI